MTGKYDIEIYNNRVHYFLQVKRNITILQGNSATGKTELIRLLQEYEANGMSSGITIKSDVRCTVLNTVDWEIRLGSIRGSIIFIDETSAFIHTQRFAELLKGSDNYFVLITRDDLGALPYSCEEIYGLRNVSDNQKYKAYHRVYNEMYKLYHMELGKKIIPETVIIEDSNSGFEFFTLLFDGNCISSHGKSNIYDFVRKNHEKSLLVVADGAAFGCEIGKLLRCIESCHMDCVIYAPESFEYLILTSGIIDVPKEVLTETYRYADSVRFMSWEEFYTAYLTDATRNKITQYSKSGLPEYYKTEGSVKKIASVIPDEIKG